MSKSQRKIGGTIALIFFGIIVLSALGVGIYFLVTNVAIGGINNPQNCGESTGILTVNSINALQEGTNISTTAKVGVNGGPVTTAITSGTTKFAVGDELEIHVSASDYIDTSVSATMKCGGLTIDVPMYYSTSDNPSIVIYDKNANTLSDNVAGNSTNLSSLSAGGLGKVRVEFTGTSLESSGDGIYVVEFPAGSNANITAGASGVTMGSATQLTSIPSVHSSLNAGSRINAFRIPAVTGNSVSEYWLQFSLGDSKDLAGGVYTDWYSEQSYVDTDGTIKVGIQDSTGTLKYENTVDYDFYIDS